MSALSPDWAYVRRGRLRAGSIKTSYEPDATRKITFFRVLYFKIEKNTHPLQLRTKTTPHSAIVVLVQRHCVQVTATNHDLLEVISSVNHTETGGVVVELAWN